nr:PREDICTED: beta-3 adrenergic receptor-like [Bemisia tabaci]XP_018912591.1 PREDICTED: beta-3 adrenergic receptor-like [Bemisia tabaci]XP_018912592.1 PREDICTED: beta-3 adrenergic receptor-like [Bemisia tabaci]
MFNIEYGALMNVCLSLLAILGLFVNLLVLIVFYRRPTLRSPSNRFVGSLIMANLLSSTVLAPVLLSDKSSVSAGLSALVVTSSVFSIVAIAVDRYSAVLSPLHYANTISRRRSLAIILMSWSLAILLSSPYVLFQCAAPIFWQTHSMVLLIVGFTFPLMALVIIYSRMYTAAHRNSMRTRRHSVCTEVDSVHRNSNATFSALLFREEGRAVKTAFMVIASYLFCWTPYFVSSTIAKFHDRALVPEELVTLCILSSSPLNPFVYVFRNEVVRKETCHLLCWWRSKIQTPKPPMLKHQPSSHFDSMSVQSFHMTTGECHHSVDTPPPADFVATYYPVTKGETPKYESVTFRLAQRRCQSCIRQNSDSSTNSCQPLLTPVPRRQRPASEPSTPKHLNNNNDSLVFKFHVPESVSSTIDSRRERHKLQRVSAVETEDTGTHV